MDVVGPRAPGLYDPADQPDQLLAVRPFVMTRPDARRVVIEPAEERGVFCHQELAVRRRRALAIFPEIPADRAVLLQIGPVGVDAHAACRIAVDHVEQMVPAGFRRTGRPVVRSCRDRPGPFVQPAADVSGNALAGGPGDAVVRSRRDMPGGEQHGDRVLAVVADRAGAVPFDRKQRPVAPEFVFDRDGIGFGPAARNLGRGSGRASRTRPNAPCRARNSPDPAGTRLPRPRARCRLFRRFPRRPVHPPCHGPRCPRRAAFRTDAGSSDIAALDTPAAASPACLERARCRVPDTAGSHYFPKEDRVKAAPEAERSEGVAKRQPDAVALQPRFRRRQIERQRLPAPVAPDHPAPDPAAFRTSPRSE